MFTKMDHRSFVLTITPGNGDSLKKDQEEETHAAGRVIIEQLENIDATLRGQNARP